MTTSSRRHLGAVAAIAVAGVAAAGISASHVRADNTPTAAPGAASTAAATATAMPTPTPVPKDSLCKTLPIKMPPTMDGLPVTPEPTCGDLSALHAPTAVDAITLYSLRRSDKLLLATLQISRFNSALDLNSATAQAAIVSGLSPTIPSLLRVGDTTVYQTQTSTLTLLTWFRGRYLFVLAVRDLISKPRTLLRDALAVRP
jgi:hypothetical protein